MNEIANAEIRMTVKHATCALAAVLVVLLGGLWAVLSFTLGGMRDDVRGIRTSLAGLQDSDKEGISRDAALDKELRGQIGEIHRAVIAQQKDLEHLVADVATLTKRVNTVAPAQFTFEGKSLDTAFVKAGIKLDQIEGVFFAPVTKAQSDHKFDKLQPVPQRQR